MAKSDGCKFTETKVDFCSAVMLENELIRITVLLDKGADIYEFTYKPAKLDVLWKSPWGLKEPGKGITTAPNSHVAWMDHYEGGWQEIFPSGGGPSMYKGVEMSFHGEASTLPWRFEVLEDSGEEIALRFTVKTFRTPFKLERTLRLKKGDSRLYLHEKLTNLGEEEMDFTWGHHPAIGAPFLAEGMIIDVPAEWVESQSRANQMTRLPRKTRFSWPDATDQQSQPLDLSVVPPEAQPSADLAFLGGLKEGWYSLTNPGLGIGFGMVWPEEIFPYMWFWQEFHGSTGWPWYKSAYVMALEPFTSFDDSGLAHCVVNGTARKLAPQKSLEVDLIALCFESTRGVSRIDSTGKVTLKK